MDAVVGLGRDLAVAQQIVLDAMGGIHGVSSVCLDLAARRRPWPISTARASR